MSALDDQLTLSEEQAAVFQSLENRHTSFFITGKAGTGKSVLLRFFVEHTKKKVVVLAPTGIAAIHVGGQTIHSFFGMDAAVQDTKDPESVHSGMTDLRRRELSLLDCIIIDEISMVRVDMMDMIDRKLRLARNQDIPFGGCQIIAFGDLFQLPPVVKEEAVEKFLHRRYGTLYFFGAPGYKERPFIFVELTKVFRQSDPAFIAMLNHIRMGETQWREMEHLNSRYSPLPPSRGTIVLTSRNDAAQEINQSRLDEIPSEEFRYAGSVSGVFEEDDLPTSLTISLKVGAQIMMLRNDPGRKWFNGTLGKVAALSEHSIHVEIEGKVYPVDQAVWIQHEYTYHPENETISRRAVGSFQQYPIRLAYAITIHKSQGQTFDSVILDYSEGAAFAPGQTYVALSRCRSFDSLYLTSTLSVEDVRVSQEIIDFIRSASDSAKGWTPMIGKDMQVLLGQSFSDSSALLPKPILAKIQPTIREMLDHPDLPGLHIEKIGSNGLFSARVDNDYRIIFAIPEDSKFLNLLFIGSHDKAYQFANKYKVEINPVTGGLQQVEAAPKRMTIRPGSPKKLSRLAALEDAQFVTMGIPEEYWEQLREKVFTSGQLTGFKGSISSEAYDTLEFILEGSPVDEAMALWDTMSEAITPAEVSEREPLFRSFTPEELISVGIPSDNVDKVRKIRTDKELEVIAATLPVLAQQSLYALKAGETIEDVRKTSFSSAKQNRDGDLDAAASSPITLAEFAPINSEEALKAILEYPSEKWRVFLHPTQSEIVRQDYNGPARIVGGAGTGKTVVIVHRARRLASECTGDEKVLVTTFGNTLKYDIDQRLNDICSQEEFSHIKVVTVDKLTWDLTKTYLQRSITYPTSKVLSLRDIWTAAMAELDMTGSFDPEFCIDEWRDVIQSHALSTLEEYLTVQRSGRGKQLDKASREKFWELAQQYRILCERKRVRDADWAQNQLAEFLQNKPECRFKTVFVDECQDLRTPALRMLRVLAGEQRKNDMYLSGDTRQRIYGGRISLSQCGININNRSRVLKLNYRTTDEIYSFAMQLQNDYQYDDMDGKSMSKDKSTCIFHGAAPFVRRFGNPDEEAQEMIRHIRSLIAASALPSDIAVMVRSNQLVYSMRDRLERNGLQVLSVTSTQPDDKSIPGVRLMTMHRGKGMEYTYVCLPCLCADIIPSKREIEKATDEEILSELLLSEANLLSVAITRAKKQVWLSYYGKPSELIERYITQM
ncbi:MAG: AAA family ATPase [Clostridia bacterium]|nr:AAA family ATPase [Clostridia bacterium]